MGSKSDTLDLSGKLLIAMPGLGDPRFARSVIFICAHSPDGAMGLVINRPARDLEFTDLLSQLGIEPGQNCPSPPIHFGGPVELGRGFVLHSAEYRGHEATLRVNDRFSMTATLDILQDITKGTGPKAALLALGYAGWGPDQLDREILANGWLTCDALPELVFDREDAGKWARALASLGVDPESLSGASGRA
ncbi:MAG: YqgE/AlgH family protein [Rhodobacteraceae bacterium]|jgi:putative transcriptional regulator|nr:YqgE/AlgH family protein [Paracoccaceae bacterium]